MRAVRFHAFGGPEVLRLEELPDPDPGRGELTIDVRAIGVNPFETYLRAGASYPDLSLPHCPGRDAAGTIRAVGGEVARWKVGDRVYVTNTVAGSYASIVSAPVASIYPLPDRLTFEQGAAVGTPCITAWRALFQRGEARSGETVLIHGASGAVGMAAVQLAARAGLRVLGTAGSEEGMTTVRALGADAVFSHRQAGYREAILAATRGEGVHLILEMLANANLGDDCRLVRKHGRIIVIGSRGPVEIKPRDLMLREADIRAMLLFNASPEALAEAGTGVLRALEAGDLTPVIAKSFPLAEAARAHERVLESGVGGKLVLLP